MFSDSAPDIEEYKQYYESIDPADAEIIYRQVVEQTAANDEMDDYVKAYSSMKPKEAAAIFDTMTDNLQLVADILDSMDAQSRANILGKMDAATAAKVTAIMEPVNREGQSAFHSGRGIPSKIRLQMQLWERRKRMGDNNVASIGKMLMQTQSGQSVTGVDGADIGTTFRKMVDQMTQIPGSSVSTGSQTAQNMQQLTPHSPEQNYDRYQYQKNKIPEQSTKDWAAGSQVSEKLESFEESVRDVIKDELQVTDEQITEAMETLGLTVADLMNPQQLAALAAELTGTEDMSALLCNEAFMNVMQSVGTLTEDLLQQLGVTAEELTQLLEDAGQTDMDADLMQTVQTADAGETDVKDAQKVYADTADGIRDTAEQPQMAAQAAETETRTEEAKDITPEETDAQAKTANAGAEEETAADAAAGSDKEQAQTGSNSNSGQQNSASQAHAGVDVHTGPTLTETVAMQGTNSAGEYAAQVDIADVVRQIVTYTRVNYTANQETTMEMQLNPEHLGKIYLEITSKDGTVSAHLTAQNEVVKEALESQIADLKQNMNQAGVKVDAVEVTVGGHEFEKNLEQNAKQEEQQAEEREKAANATRHINLNELDGLSGLMTEEETLVAKMMAEQGNSVDFTA